MQRARLTALTNGWLQLPIQGKVVSAVDPVGLSVASIARGWKPEMHADSGVIAETDIDRLVTFDLLASR